jgi:feruloyl esterase
MTIWKSIKRSAAVGTALCAAAGAAQAATCGDLSGATFGDATVTSAVETAAGSVVVPTAPTNQTVTAPVGFCRVQGVARPSTGSEIKFEVWLPQTRSAWTGRLKVNGTGGFSGTIPAGMLAQDIGDGFVTAGSNMGHDGRSVDGPTLDTAWSLNPEKVKDWGLRAHYSVTVAAKALANAMYGEPVQKAYFEGCSNGGRQGLLVAQNYPDLFDGIVAGAPSNFYPDILMWLLWTGKTLTPSAPGGAPSISLAKRQAVTSRVLATCDAADGALDGQITNPRACSFDVDSMGPAGDGTLNATEVAAAKAMYSGTMSEAGERRYTGARFGSESAWDPAFGDAGQYGNFIARAVYGGTANYDWRADGQLFSTVYDATKTALTPVTAAPSPDLRAFRARGGKVIQFHGWNDSVVPPDGSIGYFHALTQFERLQGESDTAFARKIAGLTPAELARTSKEYGDTVRQFHRLFMLPGVSHCATVPNAVQVGSTGPNRFGGGSLEPPKALRKAESHVVSALMHWVENGVAPESIVITQTDTANATVLRQRPVCPYPKQAVYNGTGSLDAASSFTCKSPVGGINADPKGTFGFNVEEGDLLHARSALEQRKLLLPNR